VSAEILFVLMEFEAWGKVAVERVAELVLAAIPAGQDPQPGKTARRSLGGVGYISHHLLFLQPDRLAPRALWLYAVPAGHAYDFRPPHTRLGAGLLHDATTELSSSRFAAGMTRSAPFAWKMHLDTRHEGYRLAIKVDPETQAPEAAAAELAAQVLHSFARIGLLNP
jgi:hypothetical protein